MAELVDAADSKSVFERSGSSSLPRGTNTEKKALRKQGLFFRLVESGWCNADRCNAPRNPLLFSAQVVFTSSAVNEPKSKKPIYEETSRGELCGSSQ